MQKLLKIADKESKEKLISSIVSNIGKLNDKKLILKWMKISQDATERELNFTNIDIINVPKKKNKTSKSYNPSPNNSKNNINAKYSNNINMQNQGMINYPNPNQIRNNHSQQMPPYIYSNNKNMMNFNNNNSIHNYHSSTYETMPIMNSLNLNNIPNYDPNYQICNMNFNNNNYKNNNFDLKNNYNL
jgi:hypothetical protein